MTRGMLNVRASLSFLLVLAYLGGIAWALYIHQLDIKSFMAGLGPLVGLALKYWFDQTKE